MKDTAVEVDQQDNLAVRRNAAASAVEPAEAESPTKESAPVEEPEPAQVHRQPCHHPASGHSAI